MNLKTIGPRKARTTRKKSIEYIDAVIRPLDNDLKRHISSYTLRASALRRNDFLPHFVIFVSFVDKQFL
jgi:hypothetical protein